MVKKLLPSGEVGDIARLSVDRMVATLGKMYVNQLRNGQSPASMPAVMLWGAPGVGKSRGVRQIAALLERELKRSAMVIDARLLLFNPVDLRGIPVPDAKKKVAIWLRPQIFDMSPSSDFVNILFLDEISAAPPSVQAAAYQIVLDRAVGEHRLPDNCIVFGAGNRVEDRTNAWKMPTALANRFCHLEIVPHADSWRRWAIENGISPLVTGYIASRPDRLCNFDPESDATAWPSPRTWEMVSQIISGIDMEIALPLVSGCIGSGEALEFMAWAAVADQLPAVMDIFSGKKCKLPSKPDALYALVSSMASHAATHRNDLVGLGHSLVFAQRMPPEFSTLLLHDYFAIDENMRKKILKLPEFGRLQQTVGKYL